eukprot:TRINITY_DN10010_c0_g1_i1.p1 TRINITY_DN10010_c0_g1~~TRINITY_DN10010_c0_g1_i1.p1  ORF type:complete len:474 (-),score=72.54 TRINITY_DN10010_c0_g1_i1:60-1481(-)
MYSYSEPTQKTPLKAYICLLGSCILSLLVGMYYLLGGLTPYLQSYYREHNPDMSIHIFSSVLLTSSLVGNLYSFSLLSVVHRVGYKTYALLAVIALSAHNFIISLSTSHIVYFLSYTFVNGFGFSIGYYALAYPSWAWFPNAKGKVTGIILGFYGLSSMPFLSLVEKLTNPNNKEPTVIVNNGKETIFLFNEEVTQNMPTTFRVLSLVTAVVGVIGWMLISIPSAEYQKQFAKTGLLDNSAKLGTTESPTTTNPTTSDDAKPQKTTTLRKSKFWKRKSFWMLTFLQYTALMPVLYLAFNYKSYGLNKFHHDHFINMVGFFGMATNGLTRPIWGLVYDWLGFKWTTRIILVIQTTLLGSMTFLEREELFMVWICMMFSTEGGLYVILPAETIRTFGVDYGTRILPFISISNQLMKVSFIVINAVLIPQFGPQPTFTFFMPGIQIFAFCLLFLYNDKKVIDFKDEIAQRLSLIHI